MFFLLQHKDNVSRFNTWRLVSFSSECDLLSMSHALVHVHLQELCLLAHFMTLTLSAAVLLIYHLTCTRALRLAALECRSWTLLYVFYVVFSMSREPVTLSIAVCTDRLHLLDHPRSQLSNHDSHAPSSTCHALLHRSRLTPLT